MRDSAKLLALAVVALLLSSLFIGKGLTPENYQFFLSRRIPKLIAILLAAMAIASSSIVFQTITNNRILTPSILGFDSLYVMIQVLLIVIFGGSSVFVINSEMNFLLATSIMLVSAMTLFGFYFKKHKRNIFTLLLIGIVLGSLFQSVTSFFTMIIDPNEFAYIQDSMFASFNNVNKDLVYWCIMPLLICGACLFRLAHKLDVLWLGADNATSLGVNTHKLTMQVIFLVTLMVSIATALIGPILFFGLVVVALTRQVFTRYQHSFLMLAGSVISIIVLVGGQWIVEHLLNFETTISVIINFFGGSYFLLLLMKQKLN